LVLATPTAIVAGIGKASSRGILIKGGVILESSGKTDVVVIDKTGTLTTGNQKVTDVISVNHYDEKYVLYMASICEKFSEHSIARTIIEYASEKNISIPDPDKFESLSGCGVIAEYKGKRICVGNRKLFNDTTTVNRILERLENEGKTVVIISVDDTIIGIIGIGDVLRPEAVSTINDLKKMDIKKIVIVTGDNMRTAKVIGSKAGISDSEIHADLLPEDKVKIIENFKNDGYNVAMVGDGINDAPALMTADVGIAMGVAGTDIAIESADIVLMTDDLSKVVENTKLSRKTLRIIKQNLIFSVVFNVVGIGLAMCGMLTPPLAAIAHQFSSITVISNSVRLLK
jgi:heavy metal translocating P-type ATPase